MPGGPAAYERHQKAKTSYPFNRTPTPHVEHMVDGWPESLNS